MPISSRHYIFDAVNLLDECIYKLKLTIDQDFQGKYEVLQIMKDVLEDTEGLLQVFLSQTLKQETEGLPGIASFDEDSASIDTVVKRLRQVLEEKKLREKMERRKLRFFHAADTTPLPPPGLPPYASRNATDTLLFRLIVALQLCSMRIDDAHFVITGRNIEKDSKSMLHIPPTGSGVLALGSAATCCCLLGIGVVAVTYSARFPTLRTKLQIGRTWLSTACYSGTAVIVGRWIRNKWNIMWMADKINKSTNDIQEWMQQWQMIQTTESLEDDEDLLEQDVSPSSQAELLDEKSRQLINYAMAQTPKSYSWQSQGEIRFLLLKRFMDVYYASVGTALNSTTNPNATSWQVPLITGAAASFYSITGTAASQKASHAINHDSRDLIQHAWGLVSLPAIKNLMLQASRLLKGASVADRLNIAGVPCFVLSLQPAPELAVALKGQRISGSKQTRSSMVSRMSTINETASLDQQEDQLHEQRPTPTTPTGMEEGTMSQRQFAGSCGRYRQRDVILHLTGGGFFAHTIASDLPYLLDWSASTGAVVICPEYALLPEHPFPKALEQVIDVYSAVVEGLELLGFELNRIIVTGESAGGNLAAALCVHLASERKEFEDALNRSFESNEENVSTETIGEEPSRMPDALMLSCAALNLSLELSHSRVVGTKDPVLPSGLISAISDAYVPAGCSKQDPLASPFFASDAILKHFPPVLLFAGSNDPLLDDSVAFNERLRRCGVESELRAAHNVPHAYWGLGTAGFPEAKQVQQECQEWLRRQFVR